MSRNSTRRLFTSFSVDSGICVFQKTFFSGFHQRLFKSSFQHLYIIVLHTYVVLYVYLRVTVPMGIRPYVMVYVCTHMWETECGSLICLICKVLR